MLITIIKEITHEGTRFLYHILRLDSSFASLLGAKFIWRFSNTIYTGPTGPSARLTPEFKLYEIMQTRLSEKRALKLAKSKSDIIAAYGLRILAHKKSDKLREAVYNCSERSGVVQDGLGCLRCPLKLSDYANGFLKLSS